MLNSVTPLFIVDDLKATIAFYPSKLGFDVLYKGGGDGNTEDLMGRDRIMLNFKAITPEVHPLEAASAMRMRACRQKSPKIEGEALQSPVETPRELP